VEQSHPFLQEALKKTQIKKKIPLLLSGS